MRYTTVTCPRPHCGATMQTEVGYDRQGGRWIALTDHEQCPKGHYFSVDERDALDAEAEGLALDATHPARVGSEA